MHARSPRTIVDLAGTGRRGRSRRAAAVMLLLALAAGLLPAAPALPLAPSPVRGAHVSATPTSVNLAGSVQSEATGGACGDWDPGCAASAFTGAGNGVYRFTSASIPAGAYEYKVALGGWSENYGSNYQHDGPNFPLAVVTPGTVTWTYDHKTHYITDSVDDVVYTLPGSWNSELGCAGDWQPECLRTFMSDTNDDGTYTFVTDEVPAGSYELKVASNESWSNPNFPANNVAFSVPALGDIVTVTFVSTASPATVTVDVESVAPPDPEDLALARHSLREALTDEVFYFVMPDRFENGDPANDDGGLTGDRMATGLDPTDKGFFHGGDLAGVIDRLDYIEQLGTTAIWMAPIFRNRPVQGTGPDASAGYHGYWTMDFTQIDPHFGTNAELEALVDAAHARGIKVFFDIITNHTADVIDYAEGEYAYRDKGTDPYLDAEGVEFDDRDYAGDPAFPPLDAATSFPYTPVFRTPEDATAKVPAWLNDPTLYHNRGDSTFVGESAEYGDFFGLDDLFTEHPAVVDGLTDIFETWVTDVGIDGFRIDTAKHVNIEFWQEFSPALQAHAAAQGNDDFFMFGEVFDGNPAFMSRYTTEGTLQATLDFGFQGRATAFAASGAATDDLAALFAQDDYYTDADSNAYSLPTFLGNHDIGRIGRAIAVGNPGATDAELLARDQLAHALMYLVRGMPVVYYGDEQGFTGDGGDKDARQDMFPSEVASYNDDDLIGTAATTADANFDQAHPLYAFLADLAALKAGHPALRSGAQVQRFSTSAPGIYAFSRIDAGEGIEYVVALNNSESEKTQAIPTYSANAGFTQIWPGTGSATTNASAQLELTVPGLSAVVYRADTALADATGAPGITITAPADGAELTGRAPVTAALSRPEFAEVTFAVKIGGAADWTVVGTDDNAPYRVYVDTADLTPGTPLQFKAVVLDRGGHVASDTASAVVGAEEPPTAGGAPDYAVVHYARPDGDYGDPSSSDYNDFWGLHAWGSIDQTVDWTDPIRFWGEDDYGRFAWIKLAANPDQVGFIVHRGDTKDPGPDMGFNPSLTPEVWVQSGDSTVYTSEAAAQGHVDIHYQRPDGVYDGWGLHLWGDALASGAGTEWSSPRMPDAIDDYGAHWKVPLADATKALNFIIHKGDEKDPGEDQGVIPARQGDVWIRSGDTTLYPTRADAEDYAVIHYHRPDGDYGDPTSSNYGDFWGLHTWAGHPDPDPAWTSPIKPARFDGFGAVFQLDTEPGAAQLAYILHRGDAKDPGPDQFLDLVTLGHEVWYLSGHVDRDDNAKYLLPIQAGGGVDANLSKAKAHWLTANTIAWDIDALPGGDYRLWVAPEGGLAVDEGAITGGVSIDLSRVPAGLSAELTATWPHLAGFQAFRIGSSDLAAAKAALTGQLAVAAYDGDGALRIATGVQVPGVLDDIYANDAPLGVTWSGGVPTISVWAPTAKSVALQRFTDSADTSADVTPMTLDANTGIWSVTGTPAWNGQQYLFDVEVFVPSTGRVEHNLVTDPYSLSLSTNSARSQIVNLADPALAPAGWSTLRKPALGDPETISIYELHVRDFSWSDETVPAAERGTYRAFARSGSDGMEHLRSLAEAGLTHVHLLPVFDIATVNEIRAEQAEPACDLPSLPPASEDQQACVEQVRATDGFNWGYDPWHYTTPEGSYATDPEGTPRIVQFREMVAGLNQTGLRVVMDVVYNHTNASGQNEKSVLDRIVPGYYHRLTLDGAVETSTCCQNTATEHEMMGRLMVDSIVTWAKDYKVDGFRFDLMGHHSKQNLLDVRAALDALTLATDGVDGKTIYLYGEGWNFGEVANNARFEQASQINMAGTGIGTFNDRLRDAVRGGGPFDNDHRVNQGFASGLWYDPNPTASGVFTLQQQRDRLLLAMDQIRVGLTGNLRDFEFTDRFGNVVKGSEVDYNGSPAGYNADPSEAITYVEAHDNETLYDSNAWKLPQGTSMADRVRAQVVALSTVALGQGVAFFHAGTDFLRSKSLDRNSYDSGDWFNRVSWDATDNTWGSGLPPAGDNASRWAAAAPLLSDPALEPSTADMHATRDRFREFLEIRRSSPLFRLGSAEEIARRLTYENTGPTQVPGLIVMRLSDEVGRDLDRGLSAIVVVFNATDEVQRYRLDGQAGRRLRLHPIQVSSKDPALKGVRYDQATGTVTVPARTTAVFVQPPGVPGGR